MHYFSCTSDGFLLLKDGDARANVYMRLHARTSTIFHVLLVKYTFSHLASAFVPHHLRRFNLSSLLESIFKEI